MSYTHLSERRNDRGYLNWLAVGDALLLLGASLRKYAENNVKEFHDLMVVTVGHGVKCTCKCILGKKPNSHERTTPCIWAQELKKFHAFSKKSNIPWYQSNCNQWHDSVHGPWEIAKLFMSDLGKQVATTKDANSTDVGSLLSLLTFCKHFKIQHSSLKAVKGWRNEWAHNKSDNRFSDIDKQQAFKDIYHLMNDPEICGIKEVQDCLLFIKKIEFANFLTFQGDELKILEEFRFIQENKKSRKLEEKMQGMEEKMQEMEEEMEGIEEKIKKVKESDRVEKLVDKTASVFLSVVLFTIPLLRNNTGMLIFWVILMFSHVGHKSVISDYGCPTTMVKSSISHLNFREFDFSSYLAYKREGFVGRKWFFLELENIFEKRPTTVGVLITGEPGSGKSALMSQLICSPYSSLLIHDNVVGYHLCEYSEKGKRDGARFVRNLVDQIASRLPEYSNHVAGNEQIRTELDTRCHKDPIGCFFSTIVGPLRTLKQPEFPQFIIIDALDECFTAAKTSDIMEILESKVFHFPKWLKIILTSRNVTSVVSRLPQTVHRTSLYAADERNVNDIRVYVKRFKSQNLHFSDRLLTAVDFSSGRIDVILDELIAQAEGNFLFVKATLQYLDVTGEKVQLHSLPTNLFDLYNIFFNRLFGAGGFESFKFLFEVLLAAYSPLPLQHFEEILKSEYEAKDVTKRIEQVSCFLRFGQDGTVRIYHQSFAEWLINQTVILSINKTRAHQSIARLLFQHMRRRRVYVTFDELAELFIHTLSGGALDIQETAMSLFNVTEMREGNTNQSILHYLVTKPTIYLPVLDFFLSKFSKVDIFDARNKTPSFYAAAGGFVRSLQSCINNGADVNSTFEGSTNLDPVFAAVVRNTEIEEFSLMHVAAAKGHTHVVELLMLSNISLPHKTKRYLSPLHLAAGNGHLEIVKFFYNYGERFDNITLHHAVVGNHLTVVTFILSTVGVRDTCKRCQPSHFSQLTEKTTIHEIHAYFCETALHAAVARGLVNMAKILLNFGKEALECKHFSGKTVLINAVGKGNYQMVDVLLEHGANVSSVCGQKISKYNNDKMCFLLTMHRQNFLYSVYCENDTCECGYTAIHVSARYDLWKMARKLTVGRIGDLIDTKDCDKDSATHLAIIYDHVDFVGSVDLSLRKIGRYLNESKVLLKH